MDEVLSQAPSDLSIEYIEGIFKKNDCKILPTLMELWQLKEKDNKPQGKWEKIRETCDAFDLEMDKEVMSKLRGSNNIPIQEEKTK